MTIPIRLTLTIIGTVLAVAPASLFAQVTAGHTLNYDAGMETSPGNGVWEDLNGTAGFNWNLGGNVLHNASPTTGHANLTGSYVFPTSASNNAADKGTMATYSNISAGEGPTDDPASFELWFRPASLSGGNQVLWETGGSGQGVSFTIQGGNTLRFELQQDAANELILTAPLTGLEGEFIQVLGTYDRNNPGTTDTLRLYINGQEFAGSPTTAAGVNDWAGGDGSGIGGQSGAANTVGAHGGSAGLNFNTFDGEIAIHRLYESVLTSSQVVDNFAAIAGEKDVHWDNGSVDTSGAVTAPYTNATDLWSERTNWRVNSTPGTQTTAPNDVRPSIIDRVNISLNDTETLDVPARIAAGDNFEVSSVRIGGNFGLGTGGDGILNVDGGTLTVSGQGLGSGIAMGFSNRDGKLNISNGALVDITAGDLLVGVENGNAGDVSEVNVTGASTLNVAGSFWIGGDQNTSADANTRGTVVIGNGADSPVVNVSGGNTEVARGGIGRFTLNSGEFNQLASNFVLAQTRNTGSTSNTDAIVNVNGGTLNVGDFVGAPTQQLNFNGGLSVFNHNGGFVNVEEDFRMATTNDTTSNATYNLDAGAGGLTIGGNMMVGEQRTAEFNFESGSYSIAGIIYVGGTDSTSATANGAANGTINIGVLGGTPTMNTNQFEVGRQRVGVVNQDGGTVNVQSGNLVIAQYANSTGTYNLNGGMVNVTNDLNMNQGMAEFNINGGSVVVGGQLQMANNTSGAIAELNIFTGGSLTVGDRFELGGDGDANNNQGGNATVNQFGGTVIAGSLHIANDSAPAANSSTYNLHSGSLTVNGQMEVGHRHVGVFNHIDGTVDVTAGNLIIGQNSNGDGTYTLDAGTLDVENQLRFNAGTGLFEQNGGTVNVGTTLDIGNSNGGDGTYRMNGGTLNAGDRVTSDVIIGNFNNASTSALMEIRDGTVNISNSIRIADTGVNSSGTLVVGTNDGSNGSPTINLNVPVGTAGAGSTNFEVADNGTGTFTFYSGTINQNDDNLITGQSVNSVANVTIGGGDGPAELNILGTGNVGDWNTNGGHGIVDVVAGGTVNVNHDLNLGNNANANSGLELTIDGGTVNVGVNGAGNIDYRNLGPQDQINLKGGTLNLTASNGGGVLGFADAATSQFSFTGGTLIDVDTATNSIEQSSADSASRFVIGIEGDTARPADGSTTTIQGNYDLNSGSLVVDIWGPGSHGGNGEAGSTLLIDPLDPSLDSDILEVTGVANLDGTLEVDLNGYEPNPFNWYDVLVAAEINILSGFEVDGVNLFRVIDDPTNAGRQILQVAVPEPASLALWSMLGLALAGFGYRRWRRQA